MKKKIISLFLTLTMTFSLMSSVSYAVGEYNIPKTTTYTTSTYTTYSPYTSYQKFSDLTDADKVSIRDVIDDNIKIMQGDEYGRFRPNDTLTKAEACAMVNRMMGYKNSYLYASSNFKDVSSAHWANQDIAQSVNLGLAKGDGNGYFYPNKELNALELITMCLRTIGIGDALDATNNWPYAHMNFVNNEHLISNYYLSVYDPITRLDAAKIVSQFLKANIWVKDARSGDYQITDDTLLSKVFKTASYNEVIITEVDKNDRKIEGLYLDDNGEYTKKIDYLYVPEAYDINEFEVGSIVSFSVSGNNILTISKDDEATNRVLYYSQVIDYDSSEGYLKLRVDGKSSKYLLSDDLLIVNVNGQTETGTYNDMAKARRLVERTISTTSTSTNYDEVSGRIILNENNKIISISISAFDYIMYVTDVGSNDTVKGAKASTYHFKSGNYKTSLSLRNKDFEIRDKDGSVIDLDDVEDDDILLISCDQDSKGSDIEPYSILKLSETVYGQVTAVNRDYEDDEEDAKIEFKDRYVEIKGIKYFFNTKFCDEASFKKINEHESDKDKITLFLDQNGLILGWYDGDKSED